MALATTVTVEGFRAHNVVSSARAGSTILGFLRIQEYLDPGTTSREGRILK